MTSSRRRGRTGCLADNGVPQYAREYFRCVREDGMMVWLFHGSKQQTTDWFLHGWWD